MGQILFYERSELPLTFQMAPKIPFIGSISAKKDDFVEIANDGDIIVPCFKCDKKLKLQPPANPVKIRCKNCGALRKVDPVATMKKKVAKDDDGDEEAEEKTISLPKRKSRATPEEEEKKEDEKVEIKCPKCARKLRIPKTKYTIKIQCPSCDQIREVRNGKLLKKETPTAVSNDDGLETISCPGCSKEFIVPAHESEVQVRCPYCSKVQTLDAPTSGKLKMGIVVQVTAADYPVTCLNCGRVYGIPRPVGSLKSRCPSCNNVQLVQPDRTLVGGMVNTDTPSEEMVECPVCSHQFPVGVKTRPVKITCPKCDFSGTLR